MKYYYSIRNKDGEIARKHLGTPEEHFAFCVSFAMEFLNGGKAINKLFASQGMPLRLTPEESPKMAMVLFVSEIHAHSSFNAEEILSDDSNPNYRVFCEISRIMEEPFDNQACQQQFVKLLSAIIVPGVTTVINTAEEIGLQLRQASANASIAQEGYASIIAKAKAVDVINSAGDKTGQTALHRAAAAGDLNKVKALITAGASVFLADKGGKKALDYVPAGAEEVKAVLGQAAAVKTSPVRFMSAASAADDLDSPILPGKKI